MWTLSLVLINLFSCWPRERKRSKEGCPFHWSRSVYRKSGYGMLNSFELVYQKSWLILPTCSCNMSISQKGDGLWRSVLMVATRLSYESIRLFDSQVLRDFEKYHCIYVVRVGRQMVIIIILFFLHICRRIRGRSWGLPIPWCSGTAVRISRDGLRFVSQWEQAEIMWEAREQRREAYEQKWSVVFVCPLALFFTPDCDLLCCFCGARSIICQHIGIPFTAKCRGIDRSKWS